MRWTRRSCWYDRADVGWSDSGPDPAWGDASARDLHQLVENAGLERPFVPVGASFGGHIIRLYHHMYPGEVSGMVFADAAHEDAGTIQGMPHRERPPIPRSVIRASPSSAAPGVLRGWVDLQRRLAQRSRRGRQVLVPNSGHGIPVEAPDAVINAVHEIVTTVRTDLH